MPLVKRTIEPIFIGRAPLDKSVKNELEGVVVNSLAGVIKQLSSLSKHAENLFGDLISEANNLYQRSATLNQRVQVLYEKTSQLDSAVKGDVRVEEFSFQNHFKSNRVEDQQILNRSTLPLALQEVYRSCAPPPNLNQFTPYREDKKEGLKFYTDPNYFYDLWVKDQNKLIEKKKKKGDKKRRKRKESKPGKQVKEVTKKKFIGVDKEFIGEEAARQQQLQQQQQISSGGYSVDPQPASSSPATQPKHATTDSYVQEHPPGGGPPPPPGPSISQMAPVAPPPPPPVGGMGAPPPPPPPPDSGGPQMMAPPPPPPPPQPFPQMMAPPLPPDSPHFAPRGISEYSAAPPPPPVLPNVPAPPPPPPPMAMQPGAPPPPMPPGAPMAPAPPPPAPVVEAPQPVSDGRSDLLRAIEMGMKLRKVERSDEVKKQEYGHDVASILKRRIFMEISDSSGGESGSDSSDSEWSD